MQRINAQQPSNEDSRMPSGLAWTTRSAVDMQARMGLIKQALYVNSLAQNRKPDEGNALTALATSFAFALDDIPTHHLGECFQRAIRQQTDDFLLTASAVNRVYQEMLPELRRQAETSSISEQRRLEAGHGS